MPPRRVPQFVLWGIYALVVLVHLGSLLAGGGMVQRVTQPMFALLLMAIILVSAPLRNRTVALIIAGLFFAWLGDTLPPFLPDALRPGAVVMFLMALVLYCVALAPLWARNRDPLRLALAIPYAGVVIGLFVACADGAGEMMPLVALYAIVLAAMAFLSSGGNGLTWMGGTLFLLSSSLLAMDWFLPGAAILLSTVWVMLTYALGQAFLVAGILRMVPSRECEVPALGAELVIVEG
ncbi:putative membrane protein YhhN [Brachybacterium muris]|uniref:lysoplasmalogenase family protein n=1 Tax=Brachybacterium muris TaxID=219301 RepID=UPI001ED9AFB6|nr:lysoplasmalogenase family protein [Brachybacterium muris]MBM7499484.1 putative membrane protein YhhN [Brachybacterium muris]MCT1430835.1 lysoplasmalogenase [Brachybacterium muris]MCT1652984.1 lysoplasmalogenase [Brachybacterium muris]MCT2178604.1 lysoplasmalogenase [Brachybacterium muris]MCT2262423.1 lysoplasmalogenase [Brachybacterium muris]